MRVRIEEEYPGELADRKADVIKALEKIEPEDQPEPPPPQWEFPVLTHVTRRGALRAEKLRGILEHKLFAVLDEE